jgi:hypothetical protein
MAMLRDYTFYEGGHQHWLVKRCISHIHDGALTFCFNLSVYSSHYLWWSINLFNSLVVMNNSSYIEKLNFLHIVSFQVVDGYHVQCMDECKTLALVVKTYVHFMYNMFIIEVNDNPE